MLKSGFMSSFDKIDKRDAVGDVAKTGATLASEKLFKNKKITSSGTKLEREQKNLKSPNQIITESCQSYFDNNPDLGIKNDDIENMTMLQFQEILKRFPSLNDHLLSDDNVIDLMMTPSQNYNYEAIKDDNLGEYYNPINPATEHDNQNLLEMLQNPYKYYLDYMYGKLRTSMWATDHNDYIKTAYNSLKPNIERTMTVNGKKNTLFESPLMALFGDDADDDRNQFAIKKIKSIANANLQGTITTSISVLPKNTNTGHEVAFSFGVDKFGKINKIMSANSQNIGSSGVNSFVAYFFPVLKMLQQSGNLSPRFDRLIGDITLERTTPEEITKLYNTIKKKKMFCEFTDEIPELKMQAKNGLCMRFAAWNAEILFWTINTFKTGMVFDKIINQLKKIKDLIIYKDRVAAGTVGSAKSVAFYNQKVKTAIKNINQKKSLKDYTESLQKSMEKILKKKGITLDGINIKIQKDPNGLVTVSLDNTNNDLTKMQIIKIQETFDFISDIFQTSNANLEMHLNENKENISNEKSQDMIIDYFVSQTEIESGKYRNIQYKTIKEQAERKKYLKEKKENLSDWDGILSSKVTISTNNLSNAQDDIDFEKAITPVQDSDNGFTKKLNQERRSGEKSIS